MIVALLILFIGFPWIYFLAPMLGRDYLDGLLLCEAVGLVEEQCFVENLSSIFKLFECGFDVTHAPAAW